MILELEAIFNVENSEKSFDYGFDIDDDGFDSPIRVSGRVRNNTGIVSLSAEARYSYSTRCAKCAKPLKSDRSVKIEHYLISHLNDEDNDLFILVEDMRLDLDELVREDIFLSMPTRFLCSKNCKGLCPICGADLNEGSCNCKAPIDPRLEALRALLDE